jgi:hypothetical protein
MFVALGTKASARSLQNKWLAKWFQLSGKNEKLNNHVSAQFQSVAKNDPYGI